MNSLLDGFAQLLDPTVIVCILVAALLGLIVGALPGLTATMAVAIAASFTVTMDMLPGMAVLLTLWVGSCFGDRIPSILVNTPGTPASIATTLDGYPMAKKGEAGIALTASAIASTVGLLVSVLVFMFAAIPLSSIALRFGPAEMFALCLFGLTMIVAVAQASLPKALIAGVFGLLLGAVGRDPMTGAERFTMGVPELSDGLPLIATLMGLFGLAEVFSQILNRSTDANTAVTQIGRWLPNRSELRRMGQPAAIGSGVGTLIGLVPGTGGDIAGLISWNESRRFSKRKAKYGTGIVEGVTASDSGSTATVGGSVTTTLALGIPGDSVMAIMLGSMVIWGLTPGPTLFSGNPSLVYSIAGILIAATLLTFVLSMLRVKGVTKLLELPRPLLQGIIIFLCIVGTFAINYSIFDVAVLLVFGLVGVVMMRFDIPAGPVVLGLILGPLAEANLRRALEINGVATIVTSPIAVVTLGIAVLVVVGPLIYGLVRGNRTKSFVDAVEDRVIETVAADREK